VRGGANERVQCNAAGAEAEDGLARRHHASAMCPRCHRRANCLNGAAGNVRLAEVAMRVASQSLLTRLIGAAPGTLLRAAALHCFSA